MITDEMRRAEDARLLEERKARFFYGHIMIRFNVRPRYSGGSPAMVPEHIALRVAQQERDSFEHDLEGIHGEQKQKRAKILGLSGIVYAQKESGRGKKFRWHRWDLITNEETRHLDDEGLRRDGYVPFVELPERNRVAIALTGDERDYERRWFKNDGFHYSEYVPERVTE